MRSRCHVHLLPCANRANTCVHQRQKTRDMETCPAFCRALIKCRTLEFLVPLIWLCVVHVLAYELCLFAIMKLKRGPLSCGRTKLHSVFRGRTPLVYKYMLLYTIWLRIRCVRISLEASGASTPYRTQTRATPLSTVLITWCATLVRRAMCHLLNILFSAGPPSGPITFAKACATCRGAKHDETQ